MEATHVEQRSSSVFRIATWTLGVLLVIVIAGVVISQFTSVFSQQHGRIEELIAHLRRGGLTVRSVEEMDETLGAQRRVRLSVDAQMFEILQFDMSNVEQAARLDQIRQSGTMEIDGSPQPVEVNGNFVLAGYADHPDRDRLARTFHGFAAPRTKELPAH